MADDFCSAATAQSLGIFRGAAFWYFNWSGRFSANVLDAICGYLGPKASPYSTGVVVALWFAALAFAIQRLLRVFHRDASIWLSVLTAAILLFVTLELTPNVGQSLYWGQGMRSLVPPLILAAIFISILGTVSLRGARRLGWFLGLGLLLTFIAGGFSETYVAVQTIALAMAVVIRFLKQDRNRYTGSALLLAGLVGSVLAMIVVISAPGNAIRRTPFPKSPAPPDIAKISVVGFVSFFDKAFGSGINLVVVAGLVVFAFSLGAFLLKDSTRVPVSRITLLVVPLAGVVLLFACHIPIAYGASLNLPDRTLIIPAHVLVMVLCAWFYLIGQKAQQYLRTQSWPAVVGIALILVFAGVSVYAGARRAEFGSALQNYAKAWQQREQLIATARSKGEQYVQVPRLYNVMALDEVEPDPKILWLTKCVQDYYGIAVLTNYDGAPDPNADLHQRQTELAAELIKPPAGASPAYLNSIYRPGRGVAQFYTTNANYEQVKSHYQSELAREGWKLFGERKLETFQRYNGAMHALFCKDHFAANLFFTGEEAPRFGYNYSLAINWGLSSGFVWGVEDCK